MSQHGNDRLKAGQIIKDFLQEEGLPIEDLDKKTKQNATNAINNWVSLADQPTIRYYYIILIVLHTLGAKIVRVEI